MFAVYKIEWTEYESGWGQRPDGVSLHKDSDTAKAFKTRYESGGDYSCYSRGDSIKLIEVDELTFNEVQEKVSVWKKNDFKGINE